MRCRSAPGERSVVDRSHEGLREVRRGAAADRTSTSKQVCEMAIATIARPAWRSDVESSTGMIRQPFIRRTQRWRKKHPERYEALLERNRTVNKERRAEVNRRSHLRRKYGLSIEVYEFLCLVQDQKCAICGEEVEKLHVDHEHGTGRVRGLLCGKCNKAIGLLNDDPQLLSAAAVYLQKRQLPLGCGDSTPIRKRHRPIPTRDGIS